MNIELKTRKKKITYYIIYNMTRDYAKQRQKYKIINLLPRLPQYFKRIFKNLN